MADVLGAMLAYLSDRFQTYGRRVHGWLYDLECGDKSESSVRAVVHQVDDEVDPFAIIGLSHNSILMDEAARLGIWANVFGLSRERMADVAPMWRGVAPDQEDWVAGVVAFLCSKLAGRPARYSGEPTARSTTRKFAVNYVHRGDAAKTGMRDFLAQLERRCGHDAGEVLVQSDDANLDVARWRAEGVTTVIEFGSAIDRAVAAEGSGWFPEWLLVPEDFSNVLYRALYPPSALANAFAVTPARRLAERPEDQEPYQASKAACADCVRPMFSDDYNDLLLLFWGIQAAGPRLTVQNVDRGLRAIPPRASPNPWTPAAYFAPGNWTFVKDMMVARWDWAGVAPGAPPGCWRMVEHGRRFRTEDWVTDPGDDNFDRFDEWPCHGEG